MTTTPPRRRRRPPTPAALDPVWTKAALRARVADANAAARRRATPTIDPTDKRTIAEALADGLDPTAPTRERLEALRTTLARVRPAE